MIPASSRRLLVPTPRCKIFHNLNSLLLADSKIFKQGVLEDGFREFDSDDVICFRDDWYVTLNKPICEVVI
jgi:hypothetical protein